MTTRERLQKVFKHSRMFRSIPSSCIEALNPQTGTIKEGDLLFQEGESADFAYVIEAGILGLFSGGLEHTTCCFRKVVQGDLVGEYGLFCDQPRSASAIALTDLKYFQFGKEDLQQMLHQSADFQTQLLASLAEAASIGRDPRQSPLNTILIHNVHPESLLTRQVLVELASHLRSQAGKTIALENPVITRHCSSEAELHHQLTEATKARDLQVLITDDPLAVSWRNQKLIDRLVILSDGTVDHADLPSRMDSEAILVRLWPMEQDCPSTQGWFSDKSFAFVLNIKAAKQSHLERLARTVLRLQNILVLGGGGARGFAHVGAIAALQELPVDDIDMVMGVSIGALVSSLAAFELTAQQILGHLERVIIDAKPYTITIPRDSLFSLSNSQRELAAFFGCSMIQDSWLVLQCFSTNLSTNQLQAWTAGDIPTAVIASMSVPGIFPPVEDATGELHVDGGILNNLPIAPARHLTDGRIIAISLDVEPDSANQYGVNRQRRRPSLGKTIINAMMCASHAASQSQEQLADVVLRPEIGHYPFMEWKSYSQIFEAGYNHARSQLPSSLASGNTPQTPSKPSSL